MKASITLEQINSGKCPCCGGKWESGKCKCCGACTKVENGNIMLSVPYEGCFVIARLDDDKVG